MNHQTFTSLRVSISMLTLIALGSCSSDSGSGSGNPNCANSKKVYVTEAAVAVNGTEYEDPVTKQKLVPGDILVFKADTARTTVVIQDLHGTADCPITLMNEGGQVKISGGMNFNNVTYFSVNGSGVAGTTYGFRIAGASASDSTSAININHKSSNIEVHNVDIFQKGYGVIANQDAVCDTSYNYPNWYFDNIYVHNNQIKNVIHDAVTIGNPDPNAVGLPITCCGASACSPGDAGAQSKNPLPARASNLRVNDNIIQNTGEGGILFSGSDTGTNVIFRNKVTNAGTAHLNGLGNGISIGLDSYATVCANSISHTWDNGFTSFGSGLSRVEHNHVDNCGTTSDNTTQSNVACLYFISRPTEPDPLDLHATVQHNDIDGPNTDVAIRADLGTGTWYITNVFCDPVTIAIDAGITYSTSCDTNDSPCENFTPVQ